MMRADGRTPKYRPSKLSRTRAFMGKISPAMIRWQPRQAGRTRPARSRASASPSLMPSSVIANPERQTVCPGIPAICLSSGTPFGAQWTLFRQALAPGAQQEGWANQQIWMAHAAVTRADTHRFNQTYARGGLGQAGVTPEPFAAWIDSWAMHGANAFNADNISPLVLNASAEDFSYTLQLETDRPLVLQGHGGYSKKSLREQASYYYSQPFFKAKGRLAIDDKPVEVEGLAWMDREWSSQPLAADQKGWDWFALHFAGGEKLMLYRMRQTDGNDFVSANHDGFRVRMFRVRGEDLAVVENALACFVRAGPPDRSKHNCRY